MTGNDQLSRMVAWLEKFWWFLWLLAIVLGTVLGVWVSAAQAGTLDQMAPGTWLAPPGSALNLPESPGILTESSCSYDQKRQMIECLGGGHLDSFDNGARGLSLATMTWQRLSPTSPKPAPGEGCGAITGPSWQDSGYYLDPVTKQPNPQAPCSRHSYQYVQYVPLLDRLCMMGAFAVYPSGQNTKPIVDCLNPDTGVWEAKGLLPMRGLAHPVASSAVDPLTGDIWWFRGHGHGLMQWHPSTNVWTYRSAPEGRIPEATCTVDTKRRRFVCFAGGSTNPGQMLVLWWAIDDPTPLLVAHEEQTHLTGYTQIANSRRPGFVYVPALDIYALYTGEAIDTDGDGVVDIDFPTSNIIAIDPVTWKAAPVPPAQTNIVTPARPYFVSQQLSTGKIATGWNNAIMGRWMWLADHGVFALVNRQQDPVYFYRPDPVAIATALGQAPPPVDTTPPNPPAALPSTATQTTVTLTWSASTDNVGVTGYVVTRGTTTLATVQALTYTDTGLAPGTSYSYAVKAIDAAGNSSTPTLVTATTLPVIPPLNTIITPLTIHELLPAGEIGTARTNALVTFGLPLAPGVTDVNQLGMQGVSAWQFTPLERWPNGDIKVVLVDAQANVSAGGTVSAALTTGTGPTAGVPMATETMTQVVVTTGTASFTLRKAAHNGLETVTVGSTRLTPPGHTGGFVLTLASGGVLSSLYDTPTVTLERNGPLAAVVRVEGRFRDSTGAAGPAGYTLRYLFTAGSSTVQISATVRNAYDDSKAFLPFKSIEYVVPTLLTNGVAMIATQESATPLERSVRLNATDRFSALQGYTEAFADSAQQGYSTWTMWLGTSGLTTPVNLTDIGARVAINGAPLKNFSADKLTDYLLGFARLTASTQEIGVAFRDMAPYFPAQFTFQGDGTVTVGLFGADNPKTPLTFDWATYETRTFAIAFDTKPVDLPILTASVQRPLFAYAPFDYYRQTKVFWQGNDRIASYPEQQQAFATAGRPGFTIPNDKRLVNRTHDTSDGGSYNQRPWVEALLTRYLQTGTGGALLHGLNIASFWADQFPWHSDGFDAGTKPYGYMGTLLINNANAPRTINGGVRVHHEVDEEHLWPEGMIEAYWLTGDTRYKEALLDFYESAYNADSGASDDGVFYRGGMSLLRIYAMAWRDTGQTRYRDRMTRFLINLVTKQAQLTSPTKLGRIPGTVCAPYASGGPLLSHALFNQGYLTAALMRVLQVMPTSAIFTDPSYPGASVTMQQVRDMLVEVGLWNTTTTYAYPPGGKPYTQPDYNCMPGAPQTTFTTYGPLDGLTGTAWAYEQSPSADLLTKGLQLARYMDAAQLSVASSEVGLLRLLYDATHQVTGVLAPVTGLIIK